MIYFELTKEQADWFDQRMKESESGRVIVPTRLCEKFRKLSGDPYLSNIEIKTYLISTVYNRK